jgi:ATP-dependent Clp protease ATP-binding subunit ClpB
MQDQPNYEQDQNLLEKFGRDLVAQVKEGKVDPVIGRDEEIRRLIRILSRKTKNNPILIGEPGVGKTAIIEGLAHRIVKNDVQANDRITIDATNHVFLLTKEHRYEKEI